MNFREIPASAATGPALRWGTDSRGAMVKILIADDHDIVRRGLRTILDGIPGWAVIAEANNGQTAMKAALELKPDVAIIDYSLPVLNGVEITRQIRKRIPGTEILI